MLWEVSQQRHSTSSAFPTISCPWTYWPKSCRAARETIKEAGAVLVGGHTLRDTEIKYGLSVTGVVSPQHLLTNRQAKAGDVLILTKSLGTGFVTTAFKANRCPDDVLSAACESMAQLNAVGRDAALALGAHAVTDITGFGLAGHACEMALASEVTLTLEMSRLPALPGAVELAGAGYRNRAITTNRQFVEPMMKIQGEIDRVRLELAFDAQTSGGLLISIDSDRADPLVQRLRSTGATTACVVGHVDTQQDVQLVLRG